MQQACARERRAPGRRHAHDARPPGPAALPPAPPTSRGAGTRAKIIGEEGLADHMEDEGLEGGGQDGGGRDGDGRDGHGGGGHDGGRRKGNVDDADEGGGGDEPRRKRNSAPAERGAERSWEACAGHASGTARGADTPRSNSGQSRCVNGQSRMPQLRSPAARAQARSVAAPARRAVARVPATAPKRARPAPPASSQRGSGRGFEGSDAPGSW